MCSHTREKSLARSEPAEKSLDDSGCVIFTHIGIYRKSLSRNLLGALTLEKYLAWHYSDVPG